MNLKLDLSLVCPSPNLNFFILQSSPIDSTTIKPCFPQMKPEASQKPKVESKKDDYLELGVPEEWIGPLQAIFLSTVDKLKEVENPENWPMI